MRDDREQSARESEPEKTPKYAREQDAPVPERPITPLEEQYQDIQSLDDPPQAEGKRD